MKCAGHYSRLAKKSVWGTGSFEKKKSVGLWMKISELHNKGARGQCNLGAQEQQNPQEEQEFYPYSQNWGYCSWNLTFTVQKWHQRNQGSGEKACGWVKGIFKDYILLTHWPCSNTHRGEHCSSDSGSLVGCPKPSPNSNNFKSMASTEEGAPIWKKK